MRITSTLGVLALSSWALNEDLVALLMSNAYSMLVSILGMAGGCAATPSFMLDSSCGRANFAGAHVLQESATQGCNAGAICLGTATGCLFQGMPAHSVSWHATQPAPSTAACSSPCPACLIIMLLACLFAKLRCLLQVTCIGLRKAMLT